MPVVMVSSLTQTGCDVTVRALELGAIDFFAKPTVDTLFGVSGGAEQIIEKVKAAARARIIPRKNVPANGTASAAVKNLAATGAAAFKLTHRLIAIGASTGGTEALKEVLTLMPASSPGIVVVLHMPAGFTHSYAQRLDGLSAVRVKEAEDNDRVLPGHVLIAPGGFQMSLLRSGAEYRVNVAPSPRVNRHCPFVDVLFDSCALHATHNAVAAILTGMGDDGARGLKAMRDAGARTIAQDEATSVVYGMPKEAVALGGAEFVLPLGEIAAKLLALA